MNKNMKNYGYGLMTGFFLGLLIGISIVVIFPMK